MYVLKHRDCELYWDDRHQAWVSRGSCTIFTQPQRIRSGCARISLPCVMWVPL